MKYRYRPPRGRQKNLSSEEQRAAAGGCGCLLLGFIILAAFGSCVGGTTSSSPPPESPSPESSSADPFVAAPPPELPNSKGCSYAGTVYDGTSCIPGGERVQVSRAVDGDTLELADGRRVRLLGVDAPEQGECGYDEATRYTAGKVASKQVWLFREPGVTTDQYHRELAYVDASSSGYVDDLGYGLAVSGHADLSDASDANASYESKISSVASIGASTGPCAQPTYTPAPDYDYPNYDYPNPGDGNDGESRYCGRHWYC